MASAYLVRQIFVSGLSISTSSAKTTARIATPTIVYANGKSTCMSNAKASAVTRPNTIWDDFNQGFMIGLQISDKPRYGYNVGGTIALRNLVFDTYTNAWKVLK